MIQNFKAYCLTLEETPARTENARKRFKNLGIEVEFFIAKKHPDGGKIGCWDSHVKIWKLAKSRGEDVVVVFEDDVIINESLDTLNEIYNSSLKVFSLKNDIISVNLFPVGWTPRDRIVDRLHEGESMTNCASIMNIKRLFEIKNETDLVPNGYHLDIQMWVDKRSKIYIKSAIVSPRLNIKQDESVEITNDYGVIGNFLIKKFGVGNFWKLWNFISVRCKKYPFLNFMTKKFVIISNKLGF